MNWKFSFLMMLMALPALAAPKPLPFQAADHVRIKNSDFYNGCTGIVVGRGFNPTYEDIEAKRPGRFMYRVQLRSCQGYVLEQEVQSSPSQLEKVLGNE